MAAVPDIVRLLAVLLLAGAVGAANNCTGFGSDCPACAKDEWSTATVSIINDTNTAFLANFKVRTGAHDCHCVCGKCCGCTKLAICGGLRPSSDDLPLSAQST